MPIYFLRHGESEANIRGVFAGQKDDSPLTVRGINQAQEASKKLQDIKIDRIIASPLRRTYETAAAVAKAKGFAVNSIETDPRILEYDMGVFTGTSNKKLTSLELTSAKGAEDAVLFRARILSFLNEYKDLSETILMVSHAGVGRAIEAAKQELDPREFYSVSPYSNGHALLLDLAWLQNMAFQELICASNNNVRVVYDPKYSHAATHFEDTPGLRELVVAVISNMDLEGQVVATYIDMGRTVGTCDVVEIDATDKIVYGVRKNRVDDGLVPFTKSREGKLCPYVAVHLEPLSATTYMLSSAWIGTYSNDDEPFPQSPKATERSVDFWSKHAFVYGSQEIVDGTETSIRPW